MLSASQCNGTMVARHQGKFPLASLNVTGECGSKATTNYEARRHRPFSMAEIKRKNCVRGEYLWESGSGWILFTMCWTMPRWSSQGQKHPFTIVFLSWNAKIIILLTVVSAYSIKVYVHGVQWQLPQNFDVRKQNLPCFFGPKWLYAIATHLLFTSGTMNHKSVSVVRASPAVHQ